MQCQYLPHNLLPQPHLRHQETALPQPVHQRHSLLPQPHLRHRRRQLHLLPQLQQRSLPLHPERLLLPRQRLPQPRRQWPVRQLRNLHPPRNLQRLQCQSMATPQQRLPHREHRYLPRRPRRHPRHLLLPLHQRNLQRLPHQILRRPAQTLFRATHSKGLAIPRKKFWPVCRPKMS